jgi:hypothetical protein
MKLKDLPKLILQALIPYAIVLICLAAVVIAAAIIPILADPHP